jgi:hypothetical protein
MGWSTGKFFLEPNFLGWRRIFITCKNNNRTLPLFGRRPTAGANDISERSDAVMQWFRLVSVQKNLIWVSGTELRGVIVGALCCNRDIPGSYLVPATCCPDMFLRGLQTCATFRLRSKRPHPLFPPFTDSHWSSNCSTLSGISGSHCVEHAILRRIVS